MTMDAVQRDTILGILGNIFSILVYLAPIPTFRRIIREKSTVGYQSMPYITALLASMLWLLYGVIKINSLLIITVNSVGCVAEIIYTSIFIYYATRQARVYSLILLGVAIVLFCIVLIASFFMVGFDKVIIVGMICMCFNTIVFAAPLAALVKVVRTRDVSSMPLVLSIALTINAVAWTAFGFNRGSLVILIPNGLGILFGLIQIIMYGVYQNSQPARTTVDV